MVDRLAADADGDGAFPRLIVQSAGNCRDPNAWANIQRVLRPISFTIRVKLGTHSLLAHSQPKLRQWMPNLDPVAPEGGLSPFTTTSETWDRAWPLKPDIVLRRWNAGKDAFGAVGKPSLNLLTTNADHVTRLLTTSNATSAASGTLHKACGGTHECISTVAARDGQGANRSFRRLGPSKCAKCICRSILPQLRLTTYHWSGTAGGAFPISRRHCGAQEFFNACSRKRAASLSKGRLSNQDARHAPSFTTLAKKRHCMISAKRQLK
jgi:hypothetical protein